MAELLNISYGNVIVAAALPAVLYYVGLYCMIDLEAVKQGLRGNPQEQKGQAWAILKEGAHLLIPVVVLVYFLIIVGASMSRSGLISIASIIIVSWFRKKTRLGLQKIIQGFIEGALSTVGIAAICASAGIIVGVIAITGMGSNLARWFLALSGGSLLITLVLTAIICMISGIGSADHSLLYYHGRRGGPALLKLGAPPLAAHLFIFYFAVVSAITPLYAGLSTLPAAFRVRR